jgi:flagellar biosynthesis protein FliQ
MILGAEIGLLVYGIYAMIKQRFSLGKRGYVSGWRAVVLGLICVSVLPCALVIGIAIGIFAAVRGIELNAFSMIWVDILVLIAAIVATSILGRSFQAQQTRETENTFTAGGSTGTYDPSNPYAPPGQQRIP